MSSKYSNSLILKHSKALEQSETPSHAGEDAQNSDYDEEGHHREPTSDELLGEMSQLNFEEITPPLYYLNIKELVQKRLSRYKMRQRRRSQVHPAHNLSMIELKDQPLVSPANKQKKSAATAAVVGPPPKPSTPNLYDVISMYDYGDRIQQWRKDVDNKKITEIDTRDSLNEDSYEGSRDLLGGENRRTNTRILRSIRASEQAQQQRDILLFIQKLKHDYQRDHPSEAVYHLQSAAPKQFKNAKDELLHKCAMKNSYLEYKRHREFLKRKHGADEAPQSPQQREKSPPKNTQPTDSIAQSQNSSSINNNNTSLLLNAESSPLRKTNNLLRQKQNPLEGSLSPDRLQLKNQMWLSPLKSAKTKSPTAKKQIMMSNSRSKSKSKLKILPQIPGLQNGGDSLQMIREEKNRRALQRNAHHSSTSSQYRETHNSNPKLRLSNFQVFNSRYKRGESRIIDFDSSQIDLNSGAGQLETVNSVRYTSEKQRKADGPVDFSNSLSNLMQSKILTLDSQYRQQMETTMPAIQQIQGEKDSRAQIERLSAIMEEREEKIARDNPQLQIVLALKRFEHKRVRQRGKSDLGVVTSQRKMPSVHEPTAIKHLHVTAGTVISNLPRANRNTQISGLGEFRDSQYNNANNNNNNKNNSGSGNANAAEQILRVHLDFIEGYINEAFKNGENFLQSDIFVIFFEGLRIIFSQQINELCGKAAQNAAGSVAGGGNSPQMRHGSRYSNAHKSIQEKLDTLNAFQKCMQKFCNYNQILQKLEKKVQSEHQRASLSLGSIERFYEVLRENDFPPLDVAKMLLLAKVTQNKEQNSEMRGFVNEVRNERIQMLFNRDFLATEKQERSRFKKHLRQWKKEHGVENFRVENY